LLKYAKYFSFLLTLIKNEIIFAFMDKIKKTIYKAVLKLLHPIAHILLRYEISHSEFSEMTRRAYVDAAFQYFSLPNRKPTISRASVITGLSRTEVARIAAINDEEADVMASTPNRATRVIGGWLSDSDFLDDQNEPKTLPLRDEEISFETLVQRYSGGITARAVLDEMVRTGAVEKVGKEHVKLIHHGFVPHGDDAEKINIFLTHANDLLSTGVYNLTRTDEAPRFQRQVTYVDMPESVVKEFEKLSYDMSMELLLKLNKWLSEKDRENDGISDEPRYRIGLGVYYFKNDNQEE
jgi:hypothetical protein